MVVKYLMVIVVAALMLMRTQAEETPSVFDCVYDIVGGCEYGEWGARLGSFVFDNSFGPFTNGVFYSRNDGGSHVLTGLCMNVLHKGTIVRVMRKRLQHGVAVCCIAIGHTVG